MLPTMEQEEKRFWVLLAIFSTLFGAGLFIVFQSLGWGLFYTIVGLIGSIGLLLKVRMRQVPIRTPLFALALMAISIFVAHTAVQISGMRQDMDVYVMPRAVTSHQVEEVRAYLSKYSPDAVTVKVIGRDEEAANYAGQLFNALRTTKWDVNPPN